MSRISKYSVWLILAMILPCCGMFAVIAHADEIEEPTVWRSLHPSAQPPAAAPRAELRKPLSKANENEVELQPIPLAEPLPFDRTVISRGTTVYRGQDNNGYEVAQAAAESKPSLSMEPRVISSRVISTTTVPMGHTVAMNPSTGVPYYAANPGVTAPPVVAMPAGSGFSADPCGAYYPAAAYGGVDTQLVPLEQATILRPLISLNSVPKQAAIGQGILGQNTIYVPGQPVRNFIRYITP